MDLKSQRIDIPCPSCGHKVQETIGRLEQNPAMRCTRCGQDIKIEAGQLRHAIAGVQRELDKLGQAIKGFGKR